MTLLLYFLIAFVISAIGSIPIGLITLNIAQKTIEKGEKAGWQVALGATIMEFIYTVVALYGLDIFSIKNDWNGYIQVGSAILFIALGIYYWTKKIKPLDAPLTSRQTIDFLQGILVGTLNLLVIPFWLFIGIWLTSNGMIFHQTSLILSFSLGSALGALLTFVGYIKGSSYLIKKSERLVKYTNRVIGALFLLLGIIQIIRFFLPVTAQ